VIGQEIDRYDPDDSGKVTSLVRASASLDHQLEQIEAALKEAVERVAHARPSEEDINRALSAYLAKHLPRASEGEPSPRHRQLESSSFTYLQKQMSAVVQKQEELEHRLTPLFPLTARLRTIARLLRWLAMLGGKRATAANSATIADNSQRP
jgi:chromosome segregation ATPase